MSSAPICLRLPEGRLPAPQISPSQTSGAQRRALTGAQASRRRPWILPVGTALYRQLSQCCRDSIAAEGRPAPRRRTAVRGVRGGLGEAIGVAEAAQMRRRRSDLLIGGAKFSVAIKQRDQRTIRLRQWTCQQVDAGRRSQQAPRARAARPGMQLPCSAPHQPNLATVARTGVPCHPIPEEERDRWSSRKSAGDHQRRLSFRSRYGSMATEWAPAWR